MGTAASGFTRTHALRVTSELNEVKLSVLYLCRNSQGGPVLQQIVDATHEM